MLDLLTASLDDVLADKRLRGAQIGVCVTDATGNVLYGRSSDSRFVPASNEKIFSALYAMDVCGPDAVFQTKVWKFKDRIVVSVPGDATLTLEQLRKARKALQIAPKTPVEVHAPFQQQLGPGWEWDDLPWAYAARTSPFAFDDAMFEVWSDKGKLRTLAPELNVRVVRSSRASRTVHYDPSTAVLTVKSPLPKSTVRLEKCAQANPFASASLALGGKGTYSDGPLPETPADLVIDSKPLSALAKTCLELSVNTQAEHLLAVGALKEGPILGRLYDVAPDRMRDYLCKVAAIDPETFRPVDGSGLSRHNSVTPNTVCKALLYASQRPYWETWKHCLDSPGEGTMTSRLKGSSFLGKTGTMDAVVCLSGYVTKADGSLLTFSFLVNGNLASANDVRAVQDRFVRTLEKG
ncbi:MAG: D-alanyl-D-alanine carboxypeptidase [Armatimonadetes bacterium]|nr:D-alanyl-D-alanine carboxypeptidase [Armatimonadota bacterium]